MQDKILTGIRVIDLADQKGVFCGKLMADMGAEVIKVEPANGDSTRRIAPFYKNQPGLENSLFHAFYNAGKKSVVLDLTDDAGKEQFLALVKSADVLIETGKPGEMDDLGLSYASLKKINPSLVYCSITAFGQTGPWAGWNAASDTILYAASGAMYELGRADRPPIQIGYNLLTNGTNLYALTGIMGQLVSRQQTGLGDWIQVSIFETAGAWRGSELGFQQQAPYYKVSMRKGSQGIMVPANFYDCKDGHAFIMASGKWMDMVQWMKDLGMDIRGKDDPKYLADQGFNKYLWEEIDEINGMVNELTLHYTMQELMEEGQRRKIPVGPAETVATLLENPQYQDRDYFTEIESPVFGSAKYPGKAIGFTVNDMCTAGAAPKLGEHTQEVLKSLKDENGTASEGQALASWWGKTAPQPGKPLTGILVLDMGWVVAGPHAGRLLEELGATVIRIETGTRLDPMRIDARRLGVTEKGSLQEGGWCFQENNRNKMGLCLNMKAPKGRQIFEKLVKQADIVSCNFAPAGFKRMGLDFETLRRIKEDIIVLNASGLGDYGPYSTYMTFAPVLSCLTGLTSLIGYEGEEPYGYPGPLADYTGGVAMASAICAALYYRNNTGRGQFIDLAQAETVMQGMGPVLLDYQLNGRLPVCPGNHDPNHQMAPHNAYECKKDDSWIMLAVAGDQEWNEVVALFREEYPEIADADYAHTADRLFHEERLDALLARIFRQQNAAKIAQRLQEAGVSAAKVNSTWDLLYDNPQAKAMGYLKRIDFPQSELEPDHFLLTGSLINFASAEPREYKLGPACGQDNDYILREMLGYDEAFIKEATEEKTFV